MKSNSSPRSRAILLALFVTFLWSTSWVLIKFGLDDIPPLTFAGLRYFLAFLALIPAYVRSNSKTPVRELSRFDWWYLIGLGLIYYTVTQGTQFLALSFLPAITLSLLLNGTAIVVAVLGIFLLREYPTWLQWIGALVFIGGALLFFYPFVIPTGQTIGYLIAAVNVLATSMASIMGRGINRQARIHPLTVTLVSMGVGSIILLGSGLFVEPLPSFNLRSWAIILWLAVVNTAFAFTLWNLTLRTLSAMESSVINNTMLIQITILAWLFLGETLTWIEAIGLVLAALGALLVQVRFGNGKAGD
jgi:drug/metabolite transporter (DMT)-like permease